ncbi:MAG: hypothetical protein JKY26_17035 [Pseudomonas sp.]|nr:hypothetical protein [Pseudomonas sp.]
MEGVVVEEQVVAQGRRGNCRIEAVGAKFHYQVIAITVLGQPCNAPVHVAQQIARDGAHTRREVTPDSILAIHQLAPEHLPVTVVIQLHYPRQIYQRDIQTTGRLDIRWLPIQKAVTGLVRLSGTGHQQAEQ